MLYPIKRFCRNVKGYWKFLVYNEEFEHSYLYETMSLKLQRMEEYQERSRLSRDWKEVRDEIKTARLLCERIANEDYVPFIDGKFMFPFWKNSWDYEEYMINQDLELLSKLLTKKSRTWWD